MKIYSESIARALSIAVRQQSEEERRAGYSGDSIQVATWKEALTALQNGERLEIRN